MSAHPKFLSYHSCGAPQPPSRHLGAQDRADQETLLYLPGERRSVIVAYLLLLVGGIFGYKVSKARPFPVFSHFMTKTI